MKKNLTKVALGIAIGLTLTNSVQAQVVTWSTSFQTGLTGTSSTATYQDDANSGYFLTLNGYSRAFDRLNPPTTPSIGGTENFGALSTANLGWAADGADYGVGISGSANWIFQPQYGFSATPSDNEIRPDQFVGVDATALKAQGLINLIFNISSLDGGALNEGALIFGIKNGETVGTLLQHILSSGSAANIMPVNITDANLALYDSFLVTADRSLTSAGGSPMLPYSSVVITNGAEATFSAPPPGPTPVPTPASLPLFGSALLSFLAFGRKKKAITVQ